jgi:hypothetical protein
VRLEEFEHLVAASAEVTGQDEFVVVGSQAILGSIDEPPDSMLQSMEVDIYAIQAPEAARSTRVTSASMRSCSARDGRWWSTP